MREPLVALAADAKAAAVLCDDASGLEAALGMFCEGRLELVGPAQDGQGSIGQRKTPSLEVDVRPAATRPTASRKKRLS
jgi:hypothetical protein